MALVLALALIAAACGDDDDAAATTAATTTTTQAATTTTAAPTTTTTQAATTTTVAATTTTAAPEPFVPVDLTLGYVMPQTGGLAVIVQALIQPIFMAVTEINESGVDLRIIPGDSGTDGQVASVTVDRLLNDEVDGIVGPAATSVTLSVIDRITGSETVMCSPSNTGASLSTYPDNGFYFRTAPSDVLQGPALADLMTADGVSNAVVIYRNDDYGRGFNDALVAALDANGVGAETSIGYDPNATSFDAEAAQVAALGVDAVVLVTFGEGAQLVQALIEAGVGPADVATYGTDGFKDSVTPEGVDPDNTAVLAGIRGTAPSAAPASGEATFPDRFAEFAPGVPTIFSPQTYDCVMTIVLAAQVAGSADPSVYVAEMNGVTRDGEKCDRFADCMELIAQGTDIDYDGASGALDFTDVGEPGVGTYDLWEWLEDGTVTTFDQAVAG
ncbi:MAG TPA: ABC transporter substrate-binding protein [Acidimicrobiia bacterium]|nr:ABC transporter substrate-binding protein [Acidimicrobiia bacterium]